MTAFVHPHGHDNTLTMEDVMIGNILRPIRANAVEAVIQQRGALTTFAIWTILRLGIVATHKHVTRSRFPKERVTAGRLGGPFLEIIQRTFQRASVDLVRPEFI